jgi:dTDP-4-amino-4,6-dideoxygalactose transaminase
MNTHDPIPFLDLVSLHRPLEEELVAVVREAVRGARFIGGPEVEGFEREFADYCGSKYCVGVANGTDAVRFALMACGVGRGDAVVSVAHTFIATTEAICQAGAEPEFVDINPATYNLDPACLEAYLAGCRRDPATGRPLGRRSGLPIKAIVPVHLYGQCADMDAIQRLADAYGLLVVEDAAQAQGAMYCGTASGHSWRRAGTFGKAAAFSFYPGKNLGACGEAGAVTTDDPEVARQVAMIRDHGQARKYYHDLEGYNGRLDAIQAGFLRVKLRRLDTWNARRREAACRYHGLLEGVDGVTLPVEPAWSRAIYHLYVIRHPQRDALAEVLKERKIYTGLHYPVPVHLQKAYAHLGYREGDLPETEKAAREILSLPMFPDLTAEQQERVAAAIREAVTSLPGGPASRRDARK